MTGGYQEASYRQPRVRPTPQKKVPFDVQKEKEVSFDAHHEFVKRNQASNFVVVPISNEGPILEMPQGFEQLFQRKPTKKVSKLKDLFKSGLALISDKDVVVELSTLVEESQISV